MLVREEGKDEDAFKTLLCGEERRRGGAVGGSRRGEGFDPMQGGERRAKLPEALLR